MITTTDYAIAVRVLEARSEATRLRSLRVRRLSGLSLLKMAELVGTWPRSVYCWELGKTKPTSPRAERWLELIEALELAFPSDEPAEAGHTTRVLADRAS